MLSAFQLENNRLTRLEVEESQPLVNAVWIDLVEPDDDERLRVQSELGQSLATRPELEDIEASARFFEDDDGLHIHSFFFFEDAEDHAGNSTVAFTIRDGRLFTLRERELPAFRLYRMRARSQSMVDGNAYELLLDLFETKIEQLADEIENIYSDLEQLSRVIMEGHQGDEYDEALSTLAELEDIGWKVRLCLMDTQRALNFLVRKARLPGGQLEQAREILRDIESLLMPTIVRTIECRNALPSMVNVRMSSPNATSWPNSARITQRCVGLPTAEATLQKLLKSCSPKSAGQAAAIASTSRG